MTGVFLTGRKSGKIRIFIIAGVLAAILAGGAVFFFKSKASKSKGAKAHAKKLEEKPKELVPLDEFIVNLADPNQPRYLKVQISLEIIADKKHKNLEEEKPKLRDAVITVLSQKKYNQLLSAEGKAHLKEELKMACNNVLGHDKVQEVLFTDFAMQ